MDGHSVMWTTASQEVVAEQAQWLTAQALQAVEPYWPFLAASEDIPRYNERKQAVNPDNFRAAVAKAVGEDLTDLLLPTVWNELDSRYKEQRRAKLAEIVEPTPTSGGWSDDYWGTFIRPGTSSVIFLYRRGHDCRFFGPDGQQVGPEQQNVAPAYAWAVSNGYQVIRDVLGPIKEASATDLDPSVFDQMADDSRWQGFGYLGERRNALANGQTDLVDKADAAILAAKDYRGRRGWNYERLFAWANSKDGRYFGDIVFGGSDPDSDISRAVQQTIETRHWSVLTAANSPLAYEGPDGTVEVDDPEIDQAFKEWCVDNLCDPTWGAWQEFTEPDIWEGADEAYERWRDERGGSKQASEGLVVYQGTSADKSDDLNGGPSPVEVQSLIGKYVLVVFYNDHGVGADYERGRFTEVTDEGVWWEREGAEGPAYPVNADDIYQITRLPEPVPANQPSLLGSLHTAPGGGVHGPYWINKRDGKFVVVNDRGEVKGTHDTYDSAREQQKALYANIPEAREQAEEDEKRKGSLHIALRKGDRIIDDKGRTGTVDQVRDSGYSVVYTADDGKRYSNYATAVKPDTDYGSREKFSVDKHLTTPAESADWNNMSLQQRRTYMMHRETGSSHDEAVSKAGYKRKGKSSARQAAYTGTDKGALTNLSDIVSWPDGHYRFTVKGIPFVLFYDEDQAYGDNGDPVPGDTVGDYSLYVQTRDDDVIGLKEIAEQHVSPRAGRSDPLETKRYAVEQLIGSIRNFLQWHDATTPEGAAAWKTWQTNTARQMYASNSKVAVSTPDRIKEYVDHLNNYEPTTHPWPQELGGGPMHSYEADKPGKKFTRIVKHNLDPQGNKSPYGGSVHSFVDNETGDVLKPDGWKRPAPGARYNLHDDESRAQLFHDSIYSGGHLYRYRGGSLIDQYVAKVKEAQGAARHKVVVGWTLNSKTDNSYSSFMDGYKAGQPQHTVAFDLDTPPTMTDQTICETVFFATNHPAPMGFSGATKDVYEAIAAQGWDGRVGPGDPPGYMGHYSLSVGDTVSVDGRVYECKDLGFIRIASKRQSTRGDFWKVIDDQLQQLKLAKSADDVVRILNFADDPYGPNAHQSPSHPISPAGFFAGSGGDVLPDEPLSEAGWTYIWQKAPYYWAMRAPDGSAITYVEGDVYKGDLGPFPFEGSRRAVNTNAQGADRYQRVTPNGRQWAPDEYDSGADTDLLQTGRGGYHPPNQPLPGVKRVPITDTRSYDQDLHLYNTGARTSTQITVHGSKVLYDQATGIVTWHSDPAGLEKAVQQGEARKEGRLYVLQPKQGRLEQVMATISADNPNLPMSEVRRLAKRAAEVVGRQ